MELAGLEGLLDEAELAGRSDWAEVARVVSKCLTTSWTLTFEAEGMTGLMVDLEADDEDCLEEILSRTGVDLEADDDECLEEILSRTGVSRVEVLSRSSSAKREVGGEVQEEKRVDEGEKADP